MPLLGGQNGDISVPKVIKTPVPAGVNGIVALLRCQFRERLFLFGIGCATRANHQREDGINNCDRMSEGTPVGPGMGLFSTLWTSWEHSSPHDSLNDRMADGVRTMRRVVNHRGYTGRRPFVYPITSTLSTGRAE